VGYPLIDADGHYYEPDDCFTRHIESRFRDDTVRVDRSRDGLGRVYVQGRRTFMSVMPGDYASAPGALQGLFVGAVADGFTHREVINAKDHPAFIERPARLALMDDQGVEAAVMLPTLGVAVEHDMADDVELTYPACGRSTAGWRRTGATAPTGASSACPCCRCSTSTGPWPSWGGSSTPAPGWSTCAPAPWAAALPPTPTTTRSGPP
jgi:hypothetical protein